MSKKRGVVFRKKGCLYKKRMKEINTELNRRGSVIVLFCLIRKIFKALPYKTVLSDMPCFPCFRRKDAYLV